MTRISLPHSLVLLGALAIAACLEKPTEPMVLPEQPSLMVVTSPNAFTQLGSGEAHSCAVRTDGIAECWGYDIAGQAPATRSPTIGSFTEVGPGLNHTCALRSDGVAECWGGVGSVFQPPSVKAAASGAFTQISSGRNHTCAVRMDGVIECWGGPVGDPFYDTGQFPATKVAASGTFTQVDGGLSHTCAVRSDGVVECWGIAVVGAASPPTKSAATGTFVEVSAGNAHTCGLRDDGVVECWGSDGQGQSPAVRSALTGVFTQISAGGAHNCALRSDGAVECWGYNEYGQAPATRVAATGVFVQVSAGNTSTCALRSDGVIECWGPNEVGESPAIKVASGIATSHLMPSAAFNAPATTILGQAFTLALNNAQVPGYSGSVTFNYRFDCGDGSGYGTFGTSSTASCLTNTIGTRSVKGIVRDQDGDQSEYTGSVAVIYAFGGLVGPVDAPPVVNLAKAGSAIPVRFSLGGDQGLAILAAGYPVSQNFACNAASSTDPIEQTVTAGSSSLAYDPASGLYRYIWKTDKAWSGTCRRLTIRLVDGMEYVALFQFD